MLSLRVDIIHLPAILLKFPISVVQRADLTCLEPSRDAVEMEGVLQGSKVLVGLTEAHGDSKTYVADTPCDGTLLASR